MSSKTIIVVEDDATIRENLQEFLESEGYPVETATNGKEGLAVIHKHGRDCLVLLDLQMPVMTGEQMLHELYKELDPRIASISVVVISARVEPVSYQVSAFLRKPLDLDLLLSTIRKYM